MKKIILLLIVISLFLTPVFMKKNETKQSISTVEKEKDECQILIKINDTTIPLEEYLVGVLAGEMPASFHEEALKAQAIASRTYVLKQTNNGQTPISATTAHQVFHDKDLREERWKAAFAQNEQKVQQAVEQTKHQVLTYEGQLITAMFHASSFQKTESAENYSNSVIPYLQSVTSPEALEATVTTYTYKDLNKLLHQNFTVAQYKNAKVRANSSGRVQSLTIANKTWTGREMRELLQLRATYFTWKSTPKGVTLTTLGYGHGVGMSQEGANTLAQGGTKAQEILAHYYPNTAVQTFDYCQK